jgi:trans-aconitate methyltransferase
MTASLIYKSASLYELSMMALYGRHYASRYRAVADLISEGSAVLDLCCGPAVLFNRYLKDKSVSYTGLDVNRKFVERLARKGARAEVWDLREDRPLPTADYVVMQASLYHFLPDARPVVDRMIEAATRQVIIAEPVRNLATSDLRLLSKVARVFTDPGSGHQPHRFTEKSLDEFFSHYSSRLSRAMLIAGGREKIYVLDK